MSETDKMERVEAELRSEQKAALCYAQHKTVVFFHFYMNALLCEIETNKTMFCPRFRLSALISKQPDALQS